MFTVLANISLCNKIQESIVFVDLEQQQGQGVWKNTHTLKQVLGISGDFHEHINSNDMYGKSWIFTESWSVNS